MDAASAQEIGGGERVGGARHLAVAEPPLALHRLGTVRGHEEREARGERRRIGAELVAGEQALRFGADA